MKPLSNHVILYDADCPLCKAYTGAFIKHSMLDHNGRQPYATITGKIQGLINADRARNEIALVNTQTGKTVYGIDSLFTIIAHAAPVFRPLFRNQVFRWFVSRLYQLISYNRKLIAAVKPAAQVSCTPDFNLEYRIYYLLLTIICTGAILNAYSPLVAGVVPAGSAWREYAVCAGQLVFQSFVLTLFNRQKKMDYLGNMMTVSMMGGLLLLPVLLLHHFFPAIPAAFFPAWFLVVAGIMLLEHMRRMKLLGLGLLPSISWVVYRLLVLALILA